MAVIKSFRAYRPDPAYAEQVAALPYDVMNSDEAREMVMDKPYSFLHVDKAEIDLPKEVDLYDARVYEKAKENLQEMIAKKVFVQEENACLYIYEQTFRGKTQTGLVGCASVDEYQNNTIKKHEFTRADKEADRIRHVDTLNANTGPIFLTYRKKADISALLDAWKTQHEPLYAFVSGEVLQRVWRIEDAKTVAELEALFGTVPALYIADGHHRAASAVRVAEKRRQENSNYTGKEEFNFFLAVYFPAEELTIMDYNRLVRDLNGNSKEGFLEKLSHEFLIEEQGETAFAPKQKHSFGLYLQHKWYALTLKNGIAPEDNPVESLDASLLQKHVLAPILGIGDPRTDARIDFVGGIRGLSELERRVDSGEMELAFSMCPVTADELMAIADAGKVMPPKSTWFEPKLLSGLFIHFLSE